MVGMIEPIGLLERLGAARYGGEEVSQLAHALQCAALAEDEGGAPALIVAALFHDIGHLVHDLRDELVLETSDDRHESLGRDFLVKWFDDDVCGPVALHVDAKRYLCAAEPSYFGGLSRASVKSLAQQGGPYDVSAAESFLAQPHADDAVRLRRWDDFAKIPGRATPPLGHFEPIVARCVRQAAQ